MMFLRSGNHNLKILTVNVQNFYGQIYVNYINDRNRIKFLRFYTIKMKPEP